MKKLELIYKLQIGSEIKYGKHYNFYNNIEKDYKKFFKTVTFLNFFVICK